MAVAYLQFAEQNVERYRLMFASRLVTDAPAESPLGKAAEESYQLLLAGIAASGHSGPYGSATAPWAQLHGLVMLKAGHSRSTAWSRSLLFETGQKGYRGRAA